MEMYGEKKHGFWSPLPIFGLHCWESTYEIFFFESYSVTGSKKGRSKPDWLIEKDELDKVVIRLSLTLEMGNRA